MKAFALRDLPKEELLGPGHRLCAGCAQPTAVRMLTKVLRGPVVIVETTGCLEVSTTIYPQTAWKVPWAHIAFENGAAVASGLEAGYKALMKKGLLDKKIDVIAIGGDGGSFDIGLQAISGALERGHDFVYICFDNEAYMNCLSTSSLIMTKDGLKQITEVRVGDEVYAFELASHKLVLKKCTGVFDNGVRDVYEVATLHHAIKATPNHPFLVLKRSGGGGNKLVWKTLSELKVGDEVVVLKNLNCGEPFGFEFTPPRYAKATRIKEIDLPRRSSPDLMEYLGIWLGDGWIRPERGEVGFASPPGSRGRERLLELHSSLFSVNVRADDGYIYVDSVDLARFIGSLGFGSGARNKTIPSWIFTLPAEERGAFVKGLMASDGCQVGNSCRYVSASFELLRRLRLLLQTMGYGVGKIHVQRKEGGEECARRSLKNSTYGYICFSRRGNPKLEKYRSQYKHRNFLTDNENFEMEKIISIEKVGKERTLDLRVEGEHNFIADGIVVHNTGIQRSGATPRGAATTTSPAGRKIPGKPEWKKDFLGICIAHGIEYAATATPAYWGDFLTKARKAIEVDGPAVLHVLAPCPLGWRYEPKHTIKVSRLAVLTRYFPLYEYERGRYKLNMKVPKPLPVEEFLKIQGRFRHLFKPEFRKEIDEIQNYVNENWERILRLCGES